MQHPIFKHEVIDTMEYKGQKCQICATADATYDEEKNRLSIALDAYLRPLGLTAKEEHIHEAWLPKVDVVEKSVSFQDMDSTVDDVFKYWTKKVRGTLSHTRIHQEC